MNTPDTIWQQLEARPSDAIRLTMLPCSDRAPVFAGLLRSLDEPATSRLLLLLVPRYLARNARLRDQLRGLVLEAVEHPADPEQAYMSLRLTEPELGDLFAVLAYDISEAVAAGNDSRKQLALFLARISGWQDLFGRVPAGGLSAIARQGLYGELFLLRRLLEAGLATENVVEAWTGPYRQPQDFRFGLVAVEVKTTIAGGQTVHISNAAQLDDAPLEALWLFHLELAAEPETGETLPGLVADLTPRLSGSAAAVFQERLLLAGYFHAQAGLYDDSWYAVRHEHVIQVTGEMPRLRASDLPAAVCNLTYSLALADLLPYRQAFSALTASLPNPVR